MKRAHWMSLAVSLVIGTVSFSAFAEQQTTVVKKSAASKKVNLTMLPAPNPMQPSPQFNLKSKSQQSRVGTVNEERNTSSSQLRPVLDPYHRTVSTGLTF